MNVEPQKTETTVSVIARDAENVGAMAAVLRGLGLVVIDPADLDGAAAQSMPLLPVLSRAISVTSSIARQARSLGLKPHAADTLVECAERLTRFLDLIGTGRLAMVSLDPLDGCWIEEAAHIQSQSGNPERTA